MDITLGCQPPYLISPHSFNIYIATSSLLAHSFIISLSSEYFCSDPTMGAEPQETPVDVKEVKQSLLETEPTTLTESISLPSLNEVEEIIDYKFENKDLLEEAFTHSSFMCSFSYERLEYVGDAVLNLLFSREHYF